MKRVVSVLLLVCMLVSLMGMGTAAYAEELADGAAVVEQSGDAPVSNPEQTGGDAEQENPTATEPPQPTEEPSTDGDGQNGTQEPEATLAPEVTAQPAADEGFFAALTDAELSTLTAELAQLGYTVTDRAGLYALAVQNGIGDLENFYIWLDNELYILENAKVEANGKLYESLDEVVALLANDSARAVTAKLLDNAAVYGLEVPAAHELTLDLNGFALVLEMQEGETAPAPVTVTDKMEKDENGDPIYSYAALTLKNGTVSAGDPNALAIYDAGRLTLANVNVVGGIHVAESYERLTMLSIEPGDAFKTGFVNGAITADAGMENAIRITGGDFITDVSAYIDTSVYECTKNDQTGLYTVARIKGAGIEANTAADANTDKTGKTDPNNLPDIKKTEEKEGNVTLAAGVELENAAVELTGLDNALGNTGVADIIDTYTDTTAASTPEITDGTELTLTVKAEVTAAEEGSYVRYDIKPIAVVNDTEVEIPNESLNQEMLLSFYTGFLPKTLEHVHDDGTAETVDSTMYSYNKTSGMVTLNVREFSTFKATDGSLANAIKTNSDGVITLDTDVTLTDSTPIEIAKDLTINLNGHTISMTGTGTDNAMFKLTNNATLTVKGGDKANSKLVVTSTAGAAAYIANIESGKLVLGDQAPATNMATFTASAPATGAGAALSVTVLCAKTSFDPSAYVSNPYVAQSNAADGWTVDEYAAKLTKVTTSGVLGGGTVTTYHKTLTDALLNVSSSSQIDEIELLRDIDLSAAGETAPAAVSTRVIISGASKYTIKGNISVGADSSAAVDAKTIQNVTIEGNMTVTTTKLNLLNVEVTGSITDSNGGSDLGLTNANIAGALSVGDGSKLDFATGSAESIIATTTASTTNRDIKLSRVNVTYSIDVGAYSNVVCNSVTAASLTIADSPEGSTIANNPTAVIKDSDIDSVTTGARMLKAELNGLRASTAIVGKETSSVEIKSLSAASNIGTLTIGDNCGTTTIEGNLNGKNTTIGTLTVGTGTNPTLGANTSSNATNDQKLVITTINSQGRTTIESGKYETLNGDGTKNTFVLYGGNYPTDYSQYCACDQDSNTGYYDHYVCKYQTAEGRYRIEQLTPKVLSVTPSTVVRGTKTPVQIVVNVPYTHACNNDTLTVTGVNNNSGTMAQSLNYGTDYTVTQETSKDAAGNDVPTGNSVITISGDYVAANTYQSYFVDTQMGKVSATASVRTTLATANRRSGIIRTGDDSNIGLLIGIMVLALAVAVAVVVILKKKKSQTDANDVTNKTKPKEPKE